MEGLLARLERSLGKFAIPQLMTYVVGAQAIVYVLEMLRPGYASFLVLSPALVMRGQAWRLVSYIFLPPASNPLFLIFALMWLWMIGRSLEEAWGAFKLNVYFLLGMLGTTAAAVITGQPMTNVFFEISLFLAFATLFPDYQLYILLLLPLRAKWLGLATVGYLVYVLVRGDFSTRIAVAAAVANYLVFFGTRLVAMARGMSTVVKQQPRRAALAREPAERARRPARTCVTCGLTDDDEGADLRVCTCNEVCGGKATIYCLAHARSHNKPS